MYKAILFDLDNTLLEVVSWEDFDPVFDQAWKEIFASEASPGEARASVKRLIDAVDANDGSSFTNKELMLNAMSLALEFEPSPLQFDRYWEVLMPKLRNNWRSVADARQAVVAAFEQNLQVVIATGMTLPMSAIELKLQWAGVPVSEFNYAFISALENMHASKPHLSYYYEVLENIECRPEECIMVGDSWDQDIAPAVTVGIPSYWVAKASEEVLDPDLPLLGRGSLSELVRWLQGRNDS